MNRFKTAFTLAEVLITLVIVGIVASMTIPTVMSRTNDLQYTAGAKKIHSDLINAIRAIQVNGEELTPENQGRSGDFSGFVLKQFCSVMSCAEVTNGGKNFFADNYKNYYLGDIGSAGGVNQAVLNNGTAITFEVDNTCFHEGICGQIMVDINGPKAPNTESMDYYIFEIVNQNGFFSIYPIYMLQLTGQPSVDSVIRVCSEYHICSGVRIYAPDKLPKK